MKDQYLSLKDAAARKGMSVGKICHYIREGRGPKSEVLGGKTIYPIASLDAWEPVKKARGPQPKAPK